MDNEKLAAAGDAVPMRARPSAGAAPEIVAARPKVPAAAERERTGVFTSLVKEDSDISGLVAYSIYKQNKLDWLQAFEAATCRAPNESELAAYIIGESTPRRLATYRHLAESTLAGKGPDVEGATPTRNGGPHVAGQGASLPTPRSLVLYGIIAVLFVAVFWFAAHYTVASH